MLQELLTQIYTRINDPILCILVCRSCYRDSLRPSCLLVNGECARAAYVRTPGWPAERVCRAAADAYTAMLTLLFGAHRPAALVLSTVSPAAHRSLAPPRLAAFGVEATSRFCR